MTNDEHLENLDTIARKINTEANAAYAELLKLLREGTMTPREAIQKVQERFVGEYEELLLAAFNGILISSIGLSTLRELRIGNLHLSGALYHHSREISAVVLGIINQHTKGFHDARKLAMQLYDGYRFVKEAVLPVRKPLPKYLMRVFGEDEAFKQLWAKSYAKSELRILAGDLITGPPLANLFARIQASKLRTSGLRAAYLQALDALENNVGQDRLANVLKTAFYERNRYFANRIAQTELHRAYTDRQSADIMDDDSFDYVQYRLSSTHPTPDICNLHANLDKFGLGKGVYPKSLTPKPPAHPFCRCVVSNRIDIFDATANERDAAERQFLRALPVHEAAQIIGSREKLRELLNGATLDDVVNAGKNPLYHLQRVGNFRGQF